VSIGTGRWAFVPNTPSRLELAPSTAEALSQADRVLGRLDGVAGALPNRRLLLAPFMRVEAVTSSRIEGTRTSLSELMQSEVDRRPAPGPEDLREVQNYVAALEYGLRHLGDLGLSLRMVRVLHTILTQGVRGAGQPGQFRDVQVHIGPPGGFAYATYVPPPPQQLARLMADWEDFAREPAGMPDLVQAAVAHYHFEAVHPFRDGNGRVGRLLIVLMMVHLGTVTLPVLYPSAFFERNRADYYDLLLGVSREGNWTAWLDFFLTGVASQAKQAIEFCDEVVALREELRALVMAETRSINALSLLDRLFENPYLTVPVTAEAMGVSQPTLRGHVALFERLGIVEERLDRRRNKMYCAPRLLAAMERAGQPR